MDLNRRHLLAGANRAAMEHGSFVPTGIAKAPFPCFWGVAKG